MHVLCGRLVGREYQEISVGVGDRQGVLRGLEGDAAFVEFGGGLLEVRDVEEDARFGAEGLEQDLLGGDCASGARVFAAGNEQ